MKCVRVRSPGSRAELTHRTPKGVLVTPRQKPAILSPDRAVRRPRTLRPPDPVHQHGRYRVATGHGARSGPGKDVAARMQPGSRRLALVGRHQRGGSQAAAVGRHRKGGRRWYRTSGSITVGGAGHVVGPCGVTGYTTRPGDGFWSNRRGRPGTCDDEEVVLVDSTLCRPQWRPGKGFEKRRCRTHRAPRRRSWIL